MSDTRNEFFKKDEAPAAKYDKQKGGVPHPASFKEKRRELREGGVVHDSQSHRKSNAALPVTDNIDYA